MIDYEEMAIPYQKALAEEKTKKLFNILLNMQSRFGLDDLQDFKKILELISANNDLHIKERIWGYTYKEKLSTEQTRDSNILDFLTKWLNSSSEEQKLSLEAHREAEEHLNCICEANKSK